MPACSVLLCVAWVPPLILCLIVTVLFIQTDHAFCQSGSKWSASSIPLTPAYSGATEASFVSNRELPVKYAQPRRRTMKFPCGTRKHHTVPRYCSLHTSGFSTLDPDILSNRRTQCPRL